MFAKKNLFDRNLDLIIIDYLHCNPFPFQLNHLFDRHLNDPQDPIVKALDPFQMLPVNEDFRSPGLVK